MSLDRIEDVEVLRDLVRVQLRESERLKTELAAAYAELKGKKPAEAQQLALRLEQIERQRDAALAQLFGPKSERRGKDKQPKPRTPQPGHGRKDQPALPLDEVLLELPEPERVCDLCGKAMAEWSGECEESEEIDFEVPRVVMKRYRRQKYRCSCGGCIKTAPAPRKLFAKARYSVNFALQIALQKYMNHMPLDRQCRDLRRLGLEVTTATLWDYLWAQYELLAPVMPRLHAHVLTKPVIGMDETPWKLLKSEKRGKSKKWWVWAQRADDAVYYHLDPSRGAKVVEQLLGDYAGTIIVDGYPTYSSVERSPDSKFQLANCWSHARREVLPFEKDPRGGRVLRVIQRMYRLESAAKRRGLSPPELLQWRQRKTRPLLNALFRWIGNQEIPSTHGLHAALTYILKRETGLKRFLDEPLLSPDNNDTERALRGVVVGRKNHYGSRSERGTCVAALFYSLLESAELAGVNTREYLGAALHSAIDGEQIPLPHELAERDSDEK